MVKVKDVLRKIDSAILKPDKQKYFESDIILTLSIIFFGVGLIILRRNNLFTYGNAFVIILIIMSVLMAYNSYKKLKDK